MESRGFYYTPEQLLQYAKFKKCKKCGGNVLPKADGEYVCEECGEIYLDDYGKIKKYMNEHNGATMQEISKNTGVSIGSIKEFIGNCKLEFKQPSSAYMKCDVCGTLLTCGKICSRCGNRLAGQDFTTPKNRLILNKVGDKPRKIEIEKEEKKVKKDSGSKLLRDLEEKRRKANQ